MPAIKRAKPHWRHAALPGVGYFNRRTGQALCLDHGVYDVDLPEGPWTVIRYGDRWEAENGETGPIRCHACGAWLEQDKLT
jgi:hypothetical protein